MYNEINSECAVAQELSSLNYKILIHCTFKVLLLIKCFLMLKPCLPVYTNMVEWKIIGTSITKVFTQNDLLKSDL